MTPGEKLCIFLKRVCSNNTNKKTKNIHILELFIIISNYFLLSLEDKKDYAVVNYWANVVNE